MSRDETGYTVEDLRSTNGTFVNGQRITAATRVTPRDAVTLGQGVGMPWPESEPRQVIMIGRAPDNDVVLNLPNISERHARLTCAGQRLTIEDLGSTNGTAVGSPDNRIEHGIVSHDDTLFFGSTAVPVARILSLSGATSRAPLSDGAIESGHASKTGPTRSHDKQSLAAVLGGIIAGLLLLLLLMGVVAVIALQSDDTETTTIAKSNQTDTVAAEGSEIIPPNAESQTAASPSEEEALTPQQRIEQSLFTVVASRPDESEAYRVGTAWAVDSHTLSTSGAVVWFLQHGGLELGLTRHFVFSNAAEREFAVSETRVHPHFEAARASVRQARERADQLLQTPPTGAAADMEQQVRNKLAVSTRGLCRDRAADPR